jgi:hypothetical protein
MTAAALPRGRPPQRKKSVHFFFLFFLSFFLSFLDFFAMVDLPSTSSAPPSALRVNDREIQVVGKPNEDEQNVSQATTMAVGNS